MTVGESLLVHKQREKKGREREKQWGGSYRPDDCNLQTVSNFVHYKCSHFWKWPLFVQLTGHSQKMGLFGAAFEKGVC